MATAFSLLELLSLAGLETAKIQGNPDRVLTGISMHAQRTGPQEMFVAISGTSTDSHLLVAEAVHAGASVIMTERDLMPYPGVTMVRVPSTRLAVGPLCQALAGNPAKHMKVAGITGTNGKTTATHLLTSILREAGANVGLIGTLGAFYDGHEVSLQMTTPGATDLAELFSGMRSAGVDHVVMEVSSHAAHQGRIDGLPFHAAGFTNLTQDHLDYHGTLPNYIAAKRRFFFDCVARTPGAVCSFNTDDPVGEEFHSSWGGAKFSCSTTNAEADVHCSNVLWTPSGTTLSLTAPRGIVRVESRLVGAFNVQNIVLAASMAYSLGVDLADIARGIAKAPPIPGRFETIAMGQPFHVIVDFAHTPDALEKVLRTARGLCRQRLIAVFGAGGDRDRKKRPAMGRVAAEHADFTIITSDNPRSEDPSLIAGEILHGISNGEMRRRRVHVQLDRRQAIEHALHMAAPGDVVVLAGKGHENYQDVGSTKLPFDDRVVARQVLATIASNFAVPAEDSAAERLA